MEKSKKFKIFLSCFIVIALFSIPLAYYFNNPNKSKEENVLGEGDILGSVPRIISLAPTVAYEGEEYVYTMKYTDNDSSVYAISYGLISGPSWLELKKNEIRGIPPVGSEGSYKFEVRIFDGENSSVQESYILVTVKDE